MSARRLVIREEFGVFHLEAEGIAASGRTPEQVILAAWKVRASQYEGAPDEPDVHGTHDMGEVIETLLGARGVRTHGIATNDGRGW